MIKIDSLGTLRIKRDPGTGEFAFGYHTHA